MSAAIVAAWWMALIGVVSCACTLCFKEQPPAHRVIDVIGVAVHAFIVWGLWSFVWGGAAP